MPDYIPAYPGDDLQAKIYVAEEGAYHYAYIHSQTYM